MENKVGGYRCPAPIKQPGEQHQARVSEQEQARIIELCLLIKSTHFCAEAKKLRSVYRSELNQLAPMQQFYRAGDFVIERMPKQYWRPMVYTVASFEAAGKMHCLSAC